jgi:FkbM family methyltransferase
LVDQVRMAGTKLAQANEPGRPAPPSFGGADVQTPARERRKARRVLKEWTKSIYSFANAVLGHLGWQIVRKSIVVGFRPALQRIKALGVEPATIFDIGVAYGTPELYAEFANGRYFLIDPLPHSLPYMRRWAQKLDASIYNLGLGETEGELQISVQKDIGGSTLYRELGSADTIGTVRVPIRRFDSLFQPADLASPCLVKIDVQGAELAVLRGMGKLIQNVDLLIVEVSSIVTLEGAAHMFETIDYMRQNGFTIYDICGLGRRPLDNALAQLDLVFCKNDSRLLQDRRWRAG